MKKKKPPKPYYWIYRGVSFLVLFFLFWKKLATGLFSLFVLFRRFSTQGLSILSDASQGLLDSETFYGYFSFSLHEAVSFVLLVGILVITHVTSVFIVAQFVLPVSKSEDRRKAAETFEAFMFGFKRVAVFVKEGGKIESYGESDDTGGGVILADLSSAVALSREKYAHSWNIRNGMEDEPEDVPGWWRKRKERRTEQRGKNKNHQEEFFVDSAGPGLTFIEKGQKISGEIDLRPQSRRENVTAFMRNGIEVNADVSVTFSLSDEPHLICFGKASAPEGVKLYWLDMDENLSGGGMAIRVLNDLDPHDVPALEAYVRGEHGNYTNPEISPSAPGTPYKFFKERVFNAAFSSARSVASGQTIRWHEVPLDAAVELFRGELLRIPYDDLYSGLGASQRDNHETRTVDALKKLKETFSRKMKLKGEVLFQYIENREQTPFRKGEIYSIEEVTKYPPIRLSYDNFNSLRSIGVVIKNASFSNLQPSNEVIKKRLLANWKARWDKEVEFINAQHELESLRIQNRNRAQIQQEMTHLLNGIFQSAHTDEALALRVFQALEAAVANPGAENDLTAREVVDMLDSLHRWLLVDRKDLYPDQNGGEAHEPTPHSP